MTSIQIQNPSAFNPLRVFLQSRTQDVFVDGPTSLPLPKRETHAEIQARGAGMTTKLSRGTVSEGGVLRVLEREVPTPTWQAGGWESLAQYVTETMEKQLREQQAAANAAAMLSSGGIARVRRVRDEWNTSPQPLLSIPPGEKRVIGLEEGKRVLIESDSEAGLQIQNESQVRTLRLRNRNSKSGEQAHVAFLAPQQVGLVIADGKSAAVVELTPQ